MRLETLHPGYILFQPHGKKMIRWFPNIRRVCKFLDLSHSTIMKCLEGKNKYISGSKQYPGYWCIKRVSDSENIDDHVKRLRDNDYVNSTNLKPTKGKPLEEYTLEEAIREIKHLRYTLGIYTTSHIK